MALVNVVWAFKDVITSSKLAQMVTNLIEHDHRLNGSWGKPNPVCRVSRTAAQTMPTAGFTIVTFDTEVFDPLAMRDPSTPSRVYAPEAGVYLVSVTGALSPSNAGGSRGVGIYVNGALRDEAYANPSTVSSRRHGPTPTVLLSLAAGDYVELGLYHDAGGNLTTDTNANTVPTMHVALLQRA